MHFLPLLYIVPHPPAPVASASARLSRDADQGVREEDDF